MGWQIIAKPYVFIIEILQKALNALKLEGKYMYHMLQHEMPLHFVNAVYAHSSRNKHPSFPQTGFDHFVSSMEVFS